MLDLQTCDENLCQFISEVLNYVRQNELYFKALLRHRESDDFYVMWGEIIKRDFHILSKVIPTYYLRDKWEELGAPEPFAKTKKWADKMTPRVLA